MKRTGIGRVWLGLMFIGVSAFADEEAPTMTKDSIQISANTRSSYHRNYDVWSWVPRAAFRVNGPIASGSQLYLIFSVPGMAAPVKFDCPTGEAVKGHWWKTECGANEVPESMESTYTGVVGFEIHLRNELKSSDATLFAGKMKVAKAHSSEHGPKVANHFVYYVEQDWNLPIAYLFFTSGENGGMKLPNFNAAFWVRGEAGKLEPHLFYQGQEVGKLTSDGNEVGKPSCKTEVYTETNQSVEASLPQQAKWARVACIFYNVVGWNKTGSKLVPLPHQAGSVHMLEGNAGEYELKIIRNNHLARSIKFTVSADGKFDNAIAK